MEDDEDDGRDHVLEEQFNRFAMAMALEDNGMAERVMEEMGYSTTLVLIPSFFVYAGTPGAFRNANIECVWATLS